MLLPVKKKFFNMRKKYTFKTQQNLSYLKKEKIFKKNLLKIRLLG